MLYHLMDNTNVTKMKKLLLILLLTASVGYGQRTAADQVAKAKDYLSTDACNSTGIAWLKSALKTDPENKEAKELLYNCDKTKYDNAINSLSENIRNFSAVTTLEKLIKQDAFNTEEANYKIAKYYFEETSGNRVSEFISRCIELNPTNLDYRWMRVSHIKKDSASVIQAIADINYMKQNGVNNDKVNLKLANIEYAWAEYIYRNKKAGVDNGYQENTYLKTAQVNIYNEAIAHFEKSLAAYKLLATDEGKYGIKNANKMIQEIRQKIKELQ